MNKVEFGKWYFDIHAQDAIRPESCVVVKKNKFINYIRSNGLYGHEELDFFLNMGSYVPLDTLKDTDETLTKVRRQIFKIELNEEIDND